MVQLSWLTEKTTICSKTNCKIRGSIPKLNLRILVYSWSEQEVKTWFIFWTRGGTVLNNLFQISRHFSRKQENKLKVSEKDSVTP